MAKSKDLFRFYDENYSKDIFTYTASASKGYVRDLSKNLAYKTGPGLCVVDIELMKDLRFPSIRSGEDVPFGICLNAMALKVAFTGSARYFYRNRIGSLSNQRALETPTTNELDKHSFEGFAFVYRFFKARNLLDKLRIPDDMIRPGRRFMLEHPSYFIALKSLVTSWNLTPQALKMQPSLKAVLESSDGLEYLNKTMSLREWWKINFRIKFNKREKTIKLFSKILYQSKNNKFNKWI